MVADPWGFLRHPRVDLASRPIAERVRDWQVVLNAPVAEAARTQAARCMDCGVAFCHAACPLANLIPTWNTLTACDQWRAAIEALHATNNFPEFTGWLCPAPCEPACVLAINSRPVTIKQIELAIIERAWAEGWVVPLPSPMRTGARIGIIGSGPAGLACAQQLARAGHDVTIVERDDRLGGLLRYGIPDFRLDKHLVDRRLAQLRAEGVSFYPGVNAGIDVSGKQLQHSFDAVVVATGAHHPRELDLPGRHLPGIHQAMEYLPLANRVQAGDIREPPISAAGRDTTVIGGGDTAADCLGTAHRQGAARVCILDHNPRPPDERDLLGNPWPQMPRTHKWEAAHEEGVAEAWACQPTAFVPDRRGQLRAVRTITVQRRRDPDDPVGFVLVPGSEAEIPTQLVLLAAGFTGTDATCLLDQLDVAVDATCGTVRVDNGWRTTASGVFACGDARRGASLIVWAIAEGRACAAAVDAYLVGGSVLPAPVEPSSGPLGGIAPTV